MPERNHCTKDSPMPKDAPGQWDHEGAECIGSNYDGDRDDFRCKDCGREWSIWYEN